MVRPRRGSEGVIPLQEGKWCGRGGGRKGLSPCRKVNGAAEEGVGRGYPLAGR